MNNRICNLKIYSSTRDSPAMRMWVSQMIKSAQIHPEGMSPSSILVIGKLSETMPRDATTMHPSIAGKARWQSAVKDRLDTLYKNAIRPYEGRASSSAEAVVFADRAELLACLCKDLLEGKAHTKWWWQRTHSDVFVENSLAKSLTSCLLEDASLLPAVIHLFAMWNQAITLARAIDSDDAISLLEAVLIEYSCTRLFEKIYEPAVVHDLASDNSVLTKNGSGSDKGNHTKTLPGKNHSGADKMRRKPGISLQLNNSGSDHSSAYPPWFTMFNRQIWDTTLSKQQACLLGVCRLAQSNPSVLRNRIFEDQIISWLEDDERYAPDRLSNIDRNDDEDRSGSIVESIEKCRAFQANTIDLDSKINAASKTDEAGIHQYSDPIRNRKNTLSGESLPHDEPLSMLKGLTSVDTEKNTDAISATEPAGSPFGGDTESSEKPYKHVFSENSDSKFIHGGEDEVDAIRKTRGDEHKEKEFDDDLDEVSWLNEACIDTQLGGCLYLINLLYQLELPECMGKTWDLDPYLSPWALLDLVTRFLVADKAQLYASDPYWKMLAMLDRRECDQPSGDSLIGKKFTSKPDYCMPVEWWDYLIQHQAHSEASSVDTVAESSNRQIEVYWSISQDQLRIWSNNCMLVECCVARAEPVQTTHSTEESNTIQLSYEQIVRNKLVPYLNDKYSIKLICLPFGQAPCECIDDYNARYIAPAVCRWASLTLPFLRYYLYTQLKLKDATADELFNRFLCLPGRIYTTSTHIDLVGDINYSTVNIRCSGLDQDPGWLPMYGRVVLFHFS